ncbi:uncharacterized protein LOC134339252 [Mobula hypostoma]|uniref:uncharacterized protein LOC134339252 n=1 Tax=Mobula hypostoma TaxID=723540 RepID=UPI002FC367A3
MARVSIATRHKVVILHQQGLSQAEISRQTGVSRCAVKALLKKHKETGKIEDQKRSGRPRKLSAAEERYIILTSLLNRKKSSTAISSELTETTGTQVHPSTVRRSLVRSGLLKLKECKTAQTRFEVGGPVSDACNDTTSKASAAGVPPSETPASEAPPEELKLTVSSLPMQRCYRKSRELQPTSDRRRKQGHPLNSEELQDGHCIDSAESPSDSSEDDSDEALRLTAMSQLSPIKTKGVKVHMTEDETIDKLVVDPSTIAQPLNNLLKDRERHGSVVVSTTLYSTSNPCSTPAAVCKKFVRSPRDRVGFLRVLRFPPKVQRRSGW